MNYGASNTDIDGGQTILSDNAIGTNGTFYNEGATVSGAVGGLTGLSGSSSAGNGFFINAGGVFGGDNGGTTLFLNTATAATGLFLMEGGTTSGVGGGFTQFDDNSNAGSGNFVVSSGSAAGAGGGSVQFSGTSSASTAQFAIAGATVAGGYGGAVFFSQQSTASNGTYTINGGTVTSGSGGFVEFLDNSVALKGQFTVNGGTVNGGFGGVVQFSGNSSSQLSSLIANSGSNGGAGGSIQFAGESTGGASGVQLNGNGNLDISAANAAIVYIGSVTGNGTVFLGSNNLTLQSLVSFGSYTFAGSIQDGGVAGGAGGSVTKQKNNTVILTGSSTYTGVTTVNAGALQVDGSIVSSTIIASGSLTGIGSVGAITLQSGGTLAPGDNSSGTLSAPSLLWESGGIIQLKLGSAPDLLKLAGSLESDYGGGPFTFNFLNGGVQAGQTYELLVATSTNFNPNGSQWTYTSNQQGLAGYFSIGYDPQIDENALDFTVEVVPEPSAIALLLCASGLIALARRRGERWRREAGSRATP